MSEITRRRLLGSGAIAAGGAVMSSLLPPNVRDALAAGPRSGSLSDIEHVVIHMQENRSFDHYFGTLAGVRGFGDPDALTLSTGKSVFYQPDTSNPDGYLLPWHLDTKHTSSQAIPSTSHAWAVQHQARNEGKMDSWLPAHLEADGAANGPYTMSYYERDDLPFHFALAENFTICDGYHCSLLGPTWPNRLYLMSAQIDPEGKNGGPITSNVVKTPYTWTTYPERLEKAGVSWRVYQEEDDYGTNVLEFFQQYQDATPGSGLYEKALTISQPGQFEYDARHGRLPAVSWIIPTSGQSEHPAYIPASGADFLASKLEAVASNRDLWEQDALHPQLRRERRLLRPRPAPVPPPGTPDEFVQVAGSPLWPIGGGIRVPCILISPWTVGGWVASETFDHTSVLQLLERLTGVMEPNITQWRRDTFGDLTSALGFSHGRGRRGAPPLPGTRQDFWQAEYEVENLPKPTVPTAAQTPPVQESHRPGGWRRHGRGVPGQTGRHALPGTTSRFEENRTTHRADFPEGHSEGEFPGKLAAAVGRQATAGATHAFVPIIVGGGFAMIDTTTYQVVSASVSETNPYGVAATPDARKLYITEAGTNLVSVVDPSGKAIGDPIVVGVYPHGVAVSPDGRTAYVANTGPDTGPGGSDTVSLIDTGSDAVTGTVTVGQAPQMLAVSPDSKRAYVTCRQGLYVINPASGHARQLSGGGAGAHGVAVSPDGGSVYVTDSQRNQVIVLDAHGHRVRQRVSVGTLPWNVAFTTDGAAAYVTNANSDTVSVIDTQTLQVTDTIAVSRVPTGISALNGEMWVAGNVSSTISVIDTTSGKVTQTVELGVSAVPTTIAFA